MSLSMRLFGVPEDLVATEIETIWHVHLCFQCGKPVFYPADDRTVVVLHIRSHEPVGLSPVDVARAQVRGRKEFRE